MRRPSHCHPCSHPLLLSLLRRSEYVTQTSWLDFLSWSISLPSSCLLTLQNETLSLEIRSGVGESRPQGTLGDTAIWAQEWNTCGNVPGCERWALPPASSGESPGHPAGINIQPPCQELLPGSLREVARVPWDTQGGPQTQTHGESGTLFICQVPSACPAVTGAET